MWDYDLFLWLNFDGGAALDAIMLFISGKVQWVPLYIFAVYLMWRKWGWRSAFLIVLSIALAVGLSDIVAGIFKKTGLLGDISIIDFEARLRPMHEPLLQGQVHFVRLGGQFGTVSGHASTTISIALLCSLGVRRLWFSCVMLAYALLIAYSRIYLGYHYPQDILLGWATGIFSAAVSWYIFKGFINKWRATK